jgi:E1A/CREB-binding protein
LLPLAGSGGGTKRGSKGSKGKRFGAGAATADEALMAKLGDTIAGMRDDFIVVHLAEPCSLCREYIADGETM